MVTLQTQEIAAVGMRRKPLISWGAVFAGWLLGFAIMVAFTYLGSAIGLSAVGFGNAESSGKALAIGSVIYAFMSWAVSFFISGLFAGWLAGHSDRAVGASHGATVWAMAMIASVLLATTGLYAGVQGTKAASEVAANAAVTAEATGADEALRENAPQAADRAGNAVQGVTAAAGRQLDQAAAALTGGNTTTPAPTGAEAAQAADAAAKATAGTMWVLFLGSMIGLAAACFGGSRGSERLVESYRRFEVI